MNVCVCDYSRVAVELVLVVGNVEKGDDDKWLVSGVVDPMGRAWGIGEDVSMSDMFHLLVHVTEPLLLSLLFLLSLSLPWLSLSLSWLSSSSRSLSLLSLLLSLHRLRVHIGLCTSRDHISSKTDTCRKRGRLLHLH